MLYPQELKENEYVCLLMIKTDEDGKIKLKKDGNEIKFHQFVKNFEQYQEIITKYKHNFHVYNALATVKIDRNGELHRREANMRQQRVLFFDFDKKDYPNFKDAYEFTKLIKNKFPDLFLHAYYDSGHGYHYYVIINPTCKIREITELNKEIAAIVGADTNACKVTQVARIPTTFNLKNKDSNGKYPLVKEVDHYSKHDYAMSNFHPCNVDYIKRQATAYIKRELQIPDEKPLEEWNYDGTSGFDIPTYPCLCTEKVLREGAVEHERNIWLGRIIAMLKMQGYIESKIREVCIDWNTRCRPPKSVSSITSEINGYLDKKDTYKLNGCWDKIKDPRVSEIVHRQCDKFYCKQAYQKTIISVDGEAGVKMSQKLLTKTRLQNSGDNSYSGYEYLIMTVLNKYIGDNSRKIFTIKDLKYRMQFKKNGKWQLCMDIATFKKTIGALVEHKCIELKIPSKEQCKKKTPTYDDICIKVKRGLKNLDENYIEFYYSVAKAFICKQITQAEYKVFLCIINNMKENKSCTLDDLDNILNMGTQNIHRAIKSLDIAQCIEVVSYRSDKGKYYNMYSHKDTDRWNDIVDNDIKVDIPNVNMDVGDMNKLHRIEDRQKGESENVDEIKIRLLA